MNIFYIISILLHAVAAPITVYILGHGGHDLPVSSGIISWPLCYITIMSASILIRMNFCKSFWYKDYIINFFLIIVFMIVYWESDTISYWDITSQTVNKIGGITYLLFSTFVFIYFAFKKILVCVILSILTIAWMVYVYTGINFLFKTTYDYTYYNTEMLPYHNILMDTIAHETHKDINELKTWYYLTEQDTRNRWYGFLSNSRASSLGSFYNDAAREQCTGEYSCDSHINEYMVKAWFDEKWSQYFQMIRDSQIEVCKRYSILYANCTDE